MAESKKRVRSAAEQPPQEGRRRRGFRIVDRALAVESDLSSCNMAIGDEELDAIARLLGEALDRLLAE
jgi:hypothetical protein